MRSELLDIPAARQQSTHLADVRGFQLTLDTTGAGSPSWPVTAEVEYVDGEREKLHVREGVPYHPSRVMRRVWFYAATAGRVLADVATDDGERLTDRAGRRAVVLFSKRGAANETVDSGDLDTSEFHTVIIAMQNSAGASVATNVYWKDPAGVLPNIALNFASIVLPVAGLTWCVADGIQNNTNAGGGPNLGTKAGYRLRVMLSGQPGNQHLVHIVGIKR